MFNAVSLS